MATLDRLFPKAQDERIRDDIRRQLMWQTDIQSDEIVVEVKDSAVVLSGRVETRLEKREAESGANAAYGVSSVTNNIRVEPKRARTDGEIQDNVAASLRMVTCVLEEIPSVSVRDGMVTLRGVVRWKFQAASAEQAADGVVGVLSVRNLIEVVPIGEAQGSKRKRLDTTPSSLSPEKPTPASSCCWGLAA